MALTSVWSPALPRRTTSATLDGWPRIAREISEAVWLSATTPWLTVGSKPLRFARVLWAGRILSREDAGRPCVLDEAGAAAKGTAG
jgi:hypothetical protein